MLAEAGDATIVFGGDLAAGPLPVETLDLIMGLDALAIRGNADRALLEDPGEGLADKWVADRLEERHRDYLANLPETIELDVDGLGQRPFLPRLAEKRRGDDPQDDAGRMAAGHAPGRRTRTSSSAATRTCSSTAPSTENAL